MGGESKSTQTQSQSSTTNPWDQAQPALKGILGQLQGQLGNTGITSAETGALDAITANAGNANQFAPQITGLLGDLFGGGGATAGLDDYKRRLAGTADGTQIGANSGLKPYLDTIANDVQSRVNGMFAGAGRDMSGANQGALARGIAEGTAPVIANQYNTDVGNARSAADALYGAESGAAKTAVANRTAGAQLAPTVFEAQNAGQKAILEAEALRRGIPTQALGLLAQIGIPIAGLGSQTTGTGTTTGTNQMSGAQQFNMIAQGIGAMMPKAPISFGG
jgi:hypothetical protein